MKKFREIDIEPVQIALARLLQIRDLNDPKRNIAKEFVNLGAKNNTEGLEDAEYDRLKALFEMIQIDEAVFQVMR